MTRKRINGTPDSPVIPADERTHLAIERTELALERTHLAWIRTVLSLIASGFAIDKLVEIFHNNRLVTGKALISQSHITGIVLVIAGMLSLLVETIYYIRRSRQLKRLRDTKEQKLVHGLLLSVLLFLIGLVLIYFILFSKPDQPM